MKTFKHILFTAALAIAATGTSVAQPTSDTFEQWHKAKYGRYSPREEARQRAEQATVAYREETPRIAETNVWFREQWFRTKFGHPSPSEAARLKSEQENSAFREETQRDVPSAASINAWFRDQYHRTKYGRPLTREESRSGSNAR